MLSHRGYFQGAAKTWNMVDSALIHPSVPVLLGTPVTHTDNSNAKRTEQYPTTDIIIIIIINSAWNNILGNLPQIETRRNCVDKCLSSVSAASRSSKLRVTCTLLKSGKKKPGGSGTQGGEGRQPSSVLAEPSVKWKRTGTSVRRTSLYYNFKMPRKLWNLPGGPLQTCTCEAQVGGSSV